MTLKALSDSVDVGLCAQFDINLRHRVRGRVSERERVRGRQRFQKIRNDLCQSEDLNYSFVFLFVLAVKLSLLTK